MMLLYHVLERFVNDLFLSSYMKIIDVSYRNISCIIVLTYVDYRDIIMVR